MGLDKPREIGGAAYPARRCEPQWLSTLRQEASRFRPAMPVKYSNNNSATVKYAPLGVLLGSVAELHYQYERMVRGGVLL